MSLDYVRKLVSGNKARFVDTENAVNLDLVYVTDRIIIMGYPAVGVSALYRNRRRDVLKFINARHGEKWWIWNLCPLYENAYSPESMHGRVSRYPFPDHHPPPLPLLPLAVREMTAWLEGDRERVAIIHCKAGKGRSGTLLCSYMLSLPALPPPPQLDQNYTRQDQIRRLRDREGETTPAMPQHQDGWLVIGAGEEYEDVHVGATSSSEDSSLVDSERIEVTVPGRPSVPRSTNSSTTTFSQPSSSPSIDIQVESTPSFDPIDVGDEGRPEEAGQRDRLNGKVDAVFKLHSSRRMKPTSSGRGVSIPSRMSETEINADARTPVVQSYLTPGRSRVLVKSVTVLLHPPTGWHKPIASLLLGVGGSGFRKAWASVGRYDDEYVEELRRRGGSGQGVDSKITWGGVGGEGVFDTNKMFRSCGKLTSEGGIVDSSVILPGDHEQYNIHYLTPRSSDGSSSLILERDREFRLKLHLSSLPMGWLWLIPAFHLPEPSSATTTGTRIHTLRFARSQLDFALGPGTAIHQVIIQLEEIPTHDDRSTARLMTSEEEVHTGYADHDGETVREDGE